MSKEFISTDYPKNFYPEKSDDYVCPTCAHRLNKKGQVIKIMDSAYCKPCIMRKNHPNYKADVRLTTMKLDEFPELKDFFKSK
jgi:hypothetical protein